MSLSFLRYCQFNIHSLCTFFIEVNKCSSDPCQNDGICFDGVQRYECECQEGWEGERCEDSK